MGVNQTCCCKCNKTSNKFFDIFKLVSFSRCQLAIYLHHPPLFDFFVLLMHYKNLPKVI